MKTSRNLSRQQAAKFLGVSRQAIDKMIRARRLKTKSVKVSVIRIPRADALRLKRERKSVASRKLRTAKRRGRSKRS